MTKKKCNLKLQWTSTVWPKWQIVIPKEAREILWIKTWDSLAIFTKDNKWIWIVKAENLNDFIRYLKNEMKDEEWELN